MIRVALDAMGGDYAPQEMVRGAVAAAAERGVEVVLVGKEDVVRQELARWKSRRGGVEVVPASQVVTMDERPVAAVNQKRDSSIVVGTNLLKRGEVSAFVSAGNTGAIVAAALLTLGRKKGIDRPALAAVFPFPAGPVLFLDLGANSECKPTSLLQFAQMGSVYMERVFGVASPRVGLLSNGEEQSKGSQLVQQTHKLLSEAALNFTGNVEGRDIAGGVVDVIVTDGFTGNVILKMGEGLGDMMLGALRQAVSSKLHLRVASALLQPALRSAISVLDYREYGGALLLGVNGNVVIGHGRSDAKTVKHAVFAAQRAVEQRVVEAIGVGTEEETEGAGRD